MKRFRERRKEEAKIRQELANKRSPYEQLKKLDQLGHIAMKERTKLAIKIEKLKGKIQA